MKGLKTIFKSRNYRIEVQFLIKLNTKFKALKWVYADCTMMSFV